MVATLRSSRATDLSFTFSHEEANQKGSNDVFSRTWGSSFSLHHRLNDNYGIGVFGFYAQSEYRNIADEVDTFGGGVLASVAHILSPRAGMILARIRCIWAW